MRLGSARRRQSRAAFRYVADDAPSEYLEAADRLVRALRAAGVHLEYSGDPRPTERAPRRAPTVAHVVAERLPEVRDAIAGGPLIAHTTWETDRLPPHWPQILNDVDRVIVPTEWARDVFVASGVTTPIGVVPPVACDPVPGDGGFPLELAPDLIVFYTLHGWDQRTVPAAVIRAFLEAFTADDRVALVVKTTPRVRASGTAMLEVARIIRNYARPPIVRLEVGEWAPERFAGLHSRGDCYVSLSHGEHWGLGALDAAAYGNPVVTTGWGGPLASLGTEPGCTVEHDLEPVPLSEADGYGPDQRWAVPRLEHAVELLRRVAEDLGAARAAAAPLRERVLRDRAPARVAAMLLDAIPELPAAPAPAPPLRSVTRTDELLLVGVGAGVWRSAFDNWVEMAERYHYPYELVGQDADEPYVRHLTKLQLLRDCFESLPRARLVFCLDAADAFVCAEPAAVLARYRSYGHPLVLSAEHRSPADAEGESPEQRWRFRNAGGYVGEAGVMADALRYGFDLEDWERYGRVCDQRAMVLYLDLPENRHRATLDHRRILVQNIAAAERYQEFDEHRMVLNARADHTVTSSVHFYGDNGRGYNLFARLYGLTPHELEATGRFRVPPTNPGPRT